MTNQIIAKSCPRCKKILPVSEFRTRLAKKDGLTSHCKPCMNNVNSKRAKQKRIVFRQNHPPRQKFKDMTGQRFDMLTVIKYSHSTKEGDACWFCKCDCGKIIVYQAKSLRKGLATSCHCKKRRPHTIRQGRVYNSWRNMLRRVRNPNNTEYQNYGGRGITVCQRWLNFDNFFADMGKPPTEKHTLERIDVNKNYEPTNCCWATIKEQCNNTRRNHFYTYQGQTKTIAQWAEIYHFEYACLRSRLRDLNWNIEKALTTPLRR